MGGGGRGDLVNDLSYRIVNCNLDFGISIEGKLDGGGGGEGVGVG